MPFLRNILIYVIGLAIANIVSVFALGFLTSFGGNFQVVGINQLAFDPLITIAYMILYYFINSFYQPSQRAQFYLFLLTLFISFTVNFVQGAIFLVVLYLVLRKLRAI